MFVLCTALESVICALCTLCYVGFFSQSSQQLQVQDRLVGSHVRPKDDAALRGATWLDGSSGQELISDYPSKNLTDNLYDPALRFYVHMCIHIYIYMYMRGSG